MSSGTDTNIVANNLESVLSRVQSATEKSGRKNGSVRLVAVSKTKPAETIMEAYEAGQRHFGENYVQELLEKSPQLPSDIKWHFIGPLQSNKAANLVKSIYPKLYCIETVSTMKLANKLNRAMEEVTGGDSEKQLGIYIQVNTSGEETKSGVSTPSEVLSLIREIQSTCPFLNVRGLMTIGAPGGTTDLDNLVSIKNFVCQNTGEEDMELSMGMSDDFEIAIEKGSTNVRVGSTIFGARDYSKQK